MVEDLTKAINAAELMRGDLLAALRIADPVASLVLLDLLADAQRVIDRLRLLLQAVDR